MFSSIIAKKWNIAKDCGYKVKGFNKEQKFRADFHKLGM